MPRLKIHRLSPRAMPNPLSRRQIALLAEAESSGVAARTMRAHSELRWLEHLGLLSTRDGARHELTDSGRRALMGVMLGARQAA